MARQKLDGVVEAVRYAPDGQVLWVRAYLRRGPTFSDRVLLDRKSLIDQIRSGKSIYAGKRIEQMASTFEVSNPIRVVQSQGEDVLIVGDQQGKCDHLEGVPLV